MTLPVVVALEAERQAGAIDRLWRMNRSAAPGLFRDELAAALEFISLAPFAGRHYQRSKTPGVQRVLLRSTRYHVYYVVRDPDALVVAAWSAVRGAGPDLRS